MVSACLGVDSPLHRHARLRVEGLGFRVRFSFTGLQDAWAPANCQLPCIWLSWCFHSHDGLCTPL